MKNELLSLLHLLKGKKILVIGDIMLDKYIWGEVFRISPEAPVPIVHVTKETYVPGGAANVANNIVSIGGEAYVCSVVGQDRSGKALVDELEKRGIKTEAIVEDGNRPTIQKIRVMGGRQQLLRMDKENSDYVDSEIEEKIIDKIKTLLSSVDAVVISDYAKGVITEKLMENVRKYCIETKKPVIVDGKPVHKLWFKDLTIITPNTNEAIEMSGIVIKKDDDVVSVGKRLMEELNTNVLITRGEKGMTLFDKEGKISDIPTKAREVYDVSGAGDTVVGVLSLGLASGMDLNSASQIANYAAGIVVGKLGTATVSIEELEQMIRNE
jgi:D-beta-D-heptose 7-phosphate kinase/D-beta-D-heptose 1-phosphate adenosyltransferase